MAIVIYSLINVRTQHDGRVTGNWVQAHIGTLETATAWARHTERTNGNKITVAVVAQVAGPVPLLSEHYARERLDV